MWYKTWPDWSLNSQATPLKAEALTHGEWILAVAYIQLWYCPLSLQIGCAPGMNTLLIISVNCFASSCALNTTSLISSLFPAKIMMKFRFFHNRWIQGMNDLNDYGITDFSSIFNKRSMFSSIIIISNKYILYVSYNNNKHMYICINILYHIIIISICINHLT